jgi:hypothetical protein
MLWRDYTPFRLGGYSAAQSMMSVVEWELSGTSLYQAGVFALYRLQHPVASGKGKKARCGRPS